MALRQSSLVVVVEVAEQERDRDRLGVASADILDDASDFAVRERRHDVAGPRDTLVHLEPVVALDEWIGTSLAEVVEDRSRAVAVRHHVAEALRRDQDDGAGPTGEHRVRGDGRPVEDQRHLGGIDPGADEGLDAVEQARGRLARHRRHFRDHGAAVAVRRDRVGERAADVDPDRPASNHESQRASPLSGAAARPPPRRS